MKILRISIVIIYLIVYGYSVFKTTVEPDNKIWGYICALVFAILSIMFVNHYMNNSKNSDNKSENN